MYMNENLWQVGAFMHLYVEEFMLAQQNTVYPADFPQRVTLDKIKIRIFKLCSLPVQFLCTCVQTQKIKRHV